MAPSEALKKFQKLLCELFQFDHSDLDFGIYRIINYKRRIIEDFINKDLPRAIAEELGKGALAEQAQAQEALEKARKKVVEVLGNDALDSDGNLDEKYRDTPVGKAYLEAQAKAQGTQSTEELEADVYNHLYTFFSRYWQEGDFISKRRYSKKERYAIPYNGEEVYLYWANHDQYYIKTGEYFTDYTYKAPNGVTVHFKLQQADVEQNNVKGKKRFFLPVLEGIQWNEVSRTLVIPFHFRPLTGQDVEQYTKKKHEDTGAQENQEDGNASKIQQDAIIAKAVEDIPKHVKATEAVAALINERRRNGEGKSVSWLEHHLRQYTRRNTRDFFIHKDLRGFLSRELDFYLKNEVLNLDEMEVAGEGLAEGWFQLMRLIKRVGNQIIDLLAQIEDFQKMLWEKKKFVTETFYVITVGNISEDFYPDIAKCEEQWEEWMRLGFLEGKPEEPLSFLKDHPTLPLDTRHFSQDFTDRLLATFNNLDEVTDGLLVHSENWQALNFLQEKYRGQVKTIYIDPPYNTGNDGFVYRDNYQHSSWLTMMRDRIVLGGTFLSNDAYCFVSIDDNEQRHLSSLLHSLYPEDKILPTITWEKRTKAQNTETSRQMLQSKVEYILPYRTQTGRQRFNLEKVGSRSYPEKDERGPYRLEEVGQMAASGIRGRQTMIYPILGVYPKEGMQWKIGKDEAARLESQGRLVLKNGRPHIVYRPGQEEDTQFSPFWSHFFDKDVYGTAEHGSSEIRDDFGFGRIIETVKPVRLIKKLLFHTTQNSDFVLDYFAGSGTTGHAVINLNREDGGRRKFILVEMADYFDTVLLPRIKKVTFTPEWKDGKPKRMATPEEAKRSPRIVKVIRLESYEDALNNLTFDEESGQKALELFKDDYLLHYMLTWETRKSETLLDVEKLHSPFSYKLLLHRDGETRERVVDLPETFAYLLGLDVQTRKVYYDGDRRYLVYRGTVPEGRTVVVIWRETHGWTPKDYERDRTFVAEQELTNGADEVFVNGDSSIPGARSLDPLFKERMFAAVRE